MQVVSGVPSPYLQAVRDARFARGPKAAARALEALADEHPNDPVVQYNEATALLCAGYARTRARPSAARRRRGATRRTRSRRTTSSTPSTSSHGYPIFQYAGKDTLLVQGQLEQRQFHQHTAERLFAKAARLHPNNADAQVAAAVGRFDMDDLSASFSRLGPLVKRFPKSQTVRFHLGLLLAWTGQGKQAVTSFAPPTSSRHDDAREGSTCVPRASCEHWD